MRFPALIALTPFLLGLVLGRELAASPSFLLGGAGILFSSLILANRIPSRLTSPITLASILVVMFLAGWARYPGAGARRSPGWDLAGGESIDLVGRVLELSRWERDGGRLQVRSASVRINGESRQGGFCFEARCRHLPGGLACGDRILLDGVVELPRGPRNPGEEGERERFRRRGIAAVVRVTGKSDLLIVDSGRRSWWSKAIAGIRSRVHETAERHFSGPLRELYLAMVLGDRRAMPRAMADDMSQAGTVHLLAVSGLHVGFVALLCYRVLRLLWIPRRPAAGAVIPLLFLYAAVTGNRPSVVRASIMGGAFLGGEAMGRRTHSLNTLAFSALLYLSIHPVAWEELGFRLSYAAAGSLVILAPRIWSPDPAPSKGGGSSWLRRLAKRGFQGLTITTVAQLGVLPLLLAHDGRVSLVSPITNLAAIPLAGLIVPLGVTLPFVDGISRNWGSAWGAGLYLLLRGLQEVSHLGAGLPGAGLVLGTPPEAFPLFYYGGLLALRWGRGVWRAGGILVLLLSLLATCLPHLTRPGCASPQPWARVFFLDVGQGDACLITSSEGTAILIDAGPRQGDWDAGERTVLPFLRRQGIGRLDLVILTHPHNDHLGGLEAVISRIPTACLVDGGQVAPTEEYARLLAAAGRLGVAYRSPLAGDTLWDDGVLRLRVLHAAREAEGEYPVVPGSMLNEGSLVIEGRAESLGFLVLGDLGRRGQSTILPFLWGTPYGITTAGHHGSRGAVSPVLIAETRPRWVLISASVGNRWGFPHKETTDAYQAAGAHIWLTGREGSLMVESSPGVITYRAANGRILERIGVASGSFNLTALLPLDKLRAY